MAEYRSTIEWNDCGESLPVPRQKIAISFNDCCVDGIMTGVVSSVTKDEDEWPTPSIVFVDGSNFNGHFSWKVID